MKDSITGPLASAKLKYLYIPEFVEWVSVTGRIIKSQGVCVKSREDYKVDPNPDV